MKTTVPGEVLQGIGEEGTPTCTFFACFAGMLQLRRMKEFIPASAIRKLSGTRSTPVVLSPNLSAWAVSQVFLSETDLPLPLPPVSSTNSRDAQSFSRVSTTTTIDRPQNRERSVYFSARRETEDVASTTDTPLGPALYLRQRLRGLSRTAIQRPAVSCPVGTRRSKHSQQTCRQRGCRSAELPFNVNSVYSAELDSLAPRNRANRAT